MKNFLLLAAALGAASMARAQLLPAPHQQNPNWMLQKMEVRTGAGLAPGPPPTTDPMPNATQKSISSVGNHRHAWDAKRQLTYEWVSQPDEMAPDKLVLVHEQRTGILYTYVRRGK